MSWFSISSRSPIGLDIDGRFINAVQLSRTARGDIVEAALSYPRADGDAPIGSSEINTVAELLDRHGFRGQHVVVAVPGSNLMTDVVEVAQRDVVDPDASAVRDELSKVHRWDRNAFEFACWSLPQRRRSSPTTNVMAVACPHERSDALLDIFDEANLYVAALDVQACALSRACSKQLKTSSGLNAILDIGWTSANLVVLRNDVIAYRRDLTDAGLNRLYMGLINTMGFDADIAEYILREIGLSESDVDANVDPGRIELVRGQITSYLNKVVDELRLSFGYVAREYDAPQIDQLILTGDGPTCPGMSDYIADQIGLDTSTASPNSLTKCRSAAASNCMEPRLCTALGLARFAWGKAA